MKGDLLSYLTVHPGMLCSVIGAGGKTSIVMGLARGLQQREQPVIITTTTKIWPPSHLSLLLADAVDGIVSHQFPRSNRAIVVGDRIGPEGKLYGLAAETVDALAAGNDRYVFLCEADGAAGRSLKAHGPGEPIIPLTSSLVLVVAGLDAIGRRLDETVAHRLEPFIRITGLKAGDILDPPHVAAAIQAAAEYAPVGADVVYMLNKADSAPSLVTAEQVHAHLTISQPEAATLVTSAGIVQAAFGPAWAHRVPA